MKYIALVVALATATAAWAQSPAPSAATILSTLRKEHPRLLATADDFRELRDRLDQQPTAAKWAAAIRAEADSLLTQPPSKYEIPDGKRLLATSRRVLDRTLALGMAFRLTGDARYSARLWRELDTAARFKDWNPSHFLDTAEMTAAFALGYDWLHAEWATEQRATLKQAIIEKGLTPSLEIYRKDRWWAAAEHNWNQVCNGGMTLGALALADEEPALAGEILERAVATVPRAMNHFAPDGAWAEGPGYWDYATKYNVLMLAALDSALGEDFGLSRIEGFSKTGDFPIHITGPLGLTFNYADAGDGAAGGPQLLWLATKFNAPSFAAWRLRLVTGESPASGSSPTAGGFAARKPTVLDLLWGSQWLERKLALQGLPTARHFRGAEVVTMRSAWDDPDATFVGFKGGDNKVNHGHLDLGSFVLDALGRRWALDLGADDYNLPGYFGKGRWDFYRCRAEGQNTLVINPGAEPDQDQKAVAPITRFVSASERNFAIADLSTAYAKSATRVQRGVELRGRAVLIQDEIVAPKPAEVWWFMHTPAEITTNGATATLTLDGRKLTARILQPAGAKFEVMPAEPLLTSPHPPRQQMKSRWSKEGSTGVRKLAIKLADVTDLTLAITFMPDEEGVESSPARPLSKW